MSYCDVEDVKARAGRLREVWSDATTPNDGDIERFIRDAGSLVDAGLAANGYTAPAVDATVLGALLPVVADIALLILVNATWPGAIGGKAATALRADLETRVYGKDGTGGYMGGMRDGTIPAFALLKEQAEGGIAGAGNFWEHEAGYSSWLDDWQSQGAYVDANGMLQVRSPLGPGVHRDSKF